MDKIERVEAVLAGRSPDRPPVSFWYHFGPENVAGQVAINAHIGLAEDYDLDFLKVMCDGRYPLPGDGLGEVVIEDATGLAGMRPMRGDEAMFGRHLDVLRGLRRHFGGRLKLCTTVFNSWNTLRRLMAADCDVHGPPTRERVADIRDGKLTRFLRETPEALGHAIDTVTETLAGFARQCVAAGADGIYLAVRDDWVDTTESGAGIYDRLVRPSDLKILAGAAEGTFNMLHVCGRPLDMARFDRYPIHAINWADRVGGPAISEVAGWLRPAICGGVDNLGTLIHGTPDDVAREVRDAIREAGGRPLMISPGCTFDFHAAPKENLRALREAVG